MKNKSNLEKLLSKNNFVVTAEVGPPKGCNPGKIKDKAEKLRGFVDSFNITDNQTAVVRLSSLSGSVIIKNMGLDPIMQISCRDKNRIGLQSEVLGASALGIKNILFISGDHPLAGNHPDSKAVYDVDSIQLIKIVKDMKEKGIFQSKNKILHGTPDIYIGAASNPFAEPFEYRIDRLEKKVLAGADFIQTQSVYNLDRFKKYMREVRNRGLDKKIHILAGITPIKSVKMAKRMKFHVPGVDIPDFLFNRIINSSNPKNEGFKIALELINEIKKIKGLSGIHITAIFWESIIPDLVKKTNLLPRP